jgi:hypothetical protein
MRVPKIWYLAFTLLLIVNLAAQAAQQNLIPESIQSFVEAWNMKSYSIAEGAFSPQFSIENIPTEFNAMALQMIFERAPVPITDCVFKEYRGNTCVVALVTEGGEMDVEFELDGKGLIVSTSLFRTTNPGPATSSAANLLPYSEIPFELVENLIIIRATVDGMEGDFILDCGAPMLVLNSKTGGESNPEVLGFTAGVGGSAEAPGIKKLKSFIWGGGTFGDFDCVTMDLSHLADQLGRPFMGLIGKAELEPFECYFDYSRKLLVLYGLDASGRRLGPQRPPAASTILRFKLSAHIPVIRATVEGKTVRMGLDTGAQANLLDLSLFPHFQRLLIDAVTDTLMGADLNQTEVSTGTLAKSSVSRRDFPDMTYAFSDISLLRNTYNIAIDGLFGYPFLSQRPFSLNYRRKILSIF